MMRRFLEIGWLSWVIGWLCAIGPLGHQGSCFGRDAADLVRISKMLSGDVASDPGEADLDGDGVVTAEDLELMLRDVHGLDAPVRLDRQAIGPAGGTAGTTECMLVVPGGAFAATETLAVDRLPPVEDPPEEVDHGPLYEIGGIPADAAASLELRLAIPDGLDSDGLLIDVGEQTFSTSGSGWRYRCVEGTVTNGQLRWMMPPVPTEVSPQGLAPRSGAAARSLPPLPSEVTASSFSRTNYVFRFRVVRYSRLTGERFDLHFPAKYSFHKSRLWNIVQAFEDAYATLNNSGGFAFSYAARTDWPLAVYLKDLGSKDGDHVSSNWGVNYDWIEMNLKLLPKLGDARITAGHEFFHLVQNMYGSTPRNLWLDEACSTWFEKQMSGVGADFIPRAYEANPRVTLRGMHVEPTLKKQLAWNPQNWFQWQAADAQSRGYGLCAFIEFLSQEPWWTPGFLRTVYTEISSGVHPVAALASAVGSPTNLKNLWKEFCLSYFSNEVYPLNANEVSRLMVDSDNAYHLAAEGHYGRSLKPSINTVTNFAQIHSFDIRVQQLGGRSIRYVVNRGDELPDPVTLATEAEALTLGDMRNLHLLATLLRPGAAAGEWVLESLPGVTTNIDTRMTHRLDVEFPRPAGKFAVLLALVNTAVDEPYDDKIPVTWRSFATTFPFERYSVAANILSDGKAPTAVCRVDEAFLKGDLGNVTLFENPAGKVMDGAKGALLRLPHDEVNGIALVINAEMEPPLIRNVPAVGGQWVVTLTEDLGWRLWTHAEVGDPVQGPLIDSAVAKTTGIVLSAPDPTAQVTHVVQRVFNALVQWQDDGSPNPGSATLHEFEATAMVVTMQGGRVSP